MADVALLVKALTESQILQPEQMAEVEVRLQRQFLEAQKLANELLRRDWVTRFQLKRLSQGKGLTLVLGPYVLLERLGEGGMGEVFKGRHMMMNRIVALKVLRKELVNKPELMQRFQREVAIAAKLVHPNIVVAYDAAEINGMHFMAMEYVPGKTLARLVRRGGPLPVGTACEYIRQAALGLQHAHEQGLAHRDIKPSNLILTTDALHQQPVIKILDFGLARINTDQVDKPPGLTIEGQVMGTPDFMSPEQAQNTRQADIRSDIYSLGCVLYYFLAGEVPFQGESMLEKLTARVTQNAPPLRTLRSEVTAELEQVVQKMMARDPAARYQTPLEVVAALTPFARWEPDPPPVALPPSPTATAAPMPPLPVPLPPRPPSWLLSCSLIALGLTTMVLIGIIAFIIFMWMKKSG